MRPKSEPEKLLEKRTAELTRLQGLLHAESAERKRLEEALRQRLDELTHLDRQRDEFLATLAHELRNPLAPIQNALAIMRQVGTSGAVAERARDMVDRQVRHLTRLLDDLLDVARLRRGKIQLQKERLEVHTLVNRAVETARPQVDSRGHDLFVSVPDHSLAVEGDPARLEQALSQLLHNAATYTEPGGRIWFTVQPLHGQVEFSVRDTGIGIAPELLASVFEPFSQADRTLARPNGGLGIGLSLVHHLVMLHQGTVSASSDGPGQGSEFTVRLPLLAADTASAVPTFSNGHHLGPLRNVLVVDDNKDAARSLATILRLWGHEVRVAYDGPSALVAAQIDNPEIVFLDLGIPGVDGYEVARQLRGDAAFKGMLIALTGYGQEEARRRSQEVGFDEHLTKPINPEKLQQILATTNAPGIAFNTQCATQSTGKQTRDSGP